MSTKTTALAYLATFAALAAVGPAAHALDAHPAAAATVAPASASPHRVDLGLPVRPLGGAGTDLPPVGPAVTATPAPAAPAHAAPPARHITATAPARRTSAPRPTPAPAVLSQPAPAPVTATQLPNETNGRQIDCPDGVHVGVMVNGIVTGCPAPTPAP